MPVVALCFPELHKECALSSHGAWPCLAKTMIISTAIEAKYSWGLWYSVPFFLSQNFKKDILLPWLSIAPKRAGYSLSRRLVLYLSLGFSIFLALSIFIYKMVQSFLLKYILDQRPKNRNIVGHPSNTMVFWIFDPGPTFTKERTPWPSYP